MGLNYLITGGCGFIGSALARRLHREGHNIRIVDNLSVGTVDAVKPVVLTRQSAADTGTWPRASLVVGDIRDRALAQQAAVGADVCIHLAANTGVMPSIENPFLDCETNVIGTLNYLQASRENGTKRFVFASSSAPLGSQLPPLHEELAPHPLSPYGASKLAGEGYCSAYYGSFGLETVCLRFGNVYGPGSSKKESVIAKFIKQAFAGDTLTIFGDGNQTRDFIFIDDIVEGLILASRIGKIGGETFQIATQREHTVDEIAKFVANEFTERYHRRVALQYADARSGEIFRNFSNVEKAKRMLGFESKTHLSSGIALTIDYFEAILGKSTKATNETWATTEK